jgi:hypothetical protein
MALRIKKPAPPPPHIDHPTAAFWMEREIAESAARLAATGAHEAFDERVPVDVLGADPVWYRALLLADEERPLVVLFRSLDDRTAYTEAYRAGNAEGVMAVPVRLVRYSALPHDHPFLKAARREQLTLHRGWLPSFSEYTPGQPMRPLATEADVRAMRVVLDALTHFAESWSQGTAERSPETVIVATTSYDGVPLRVRAANPVGALMSHLAELDEEAAADDADGDDDAR